MHDHFPVGFFNDFKMTFELVPGINLKGLQIQMLKPLRKLINLCLIYTLLNGLLSKSTLLYLYPFVSLLIITLSPIRPLSVPHNWWFHTIIFINQITITHFMSPFHWRLLWTFFHFTTVHRWFRLGFSVEDASVSFLLLHNRSLVQVLILLYFLYTQKLVKNCWDNLLIVVDVAAFICWLVHGNWYCCW